MSFKAWRVKVCIAQAHQPTLSPLQAPRQTSAAAVSSEPCPGDKPALVCPSLTQLLDLMDVGVSPSGSSNPKVSKPSLGVRVLRTLFDNSPPTYTSAKSQPAAAAAQAKEQQRLQEQQKAQGSGGNSKSSTRPPTPRKQVEEPQSTRNGQNVIDKLAEKSGKFPQGGSKNKGGHGRKAAHGSSRASVVSEGQSSVESHDSRDRRHDHDDAHSSVSTDSEYDSSLHRYHDKEVRNMNRSAVRDHEDDYDLGSGHVDDDSLLPDSDHELNSAQKLQQLKQEIERLRFENLVLKQRGVASQRHPYDSTSDLSRASSVTEVSNVDEAAEEWIPYAEYHPSAGTASVARFHGAQPPNGYRRAEIPRHPPGERYFPGEHAARALNAGPGSSSETVSMVTDGSRASSRHNSGLLNEEPQSGLTTREHSRHNSGLRSDHEDLPSMMSWDGSRHNSGPMVVDRQELYGLAPSRDQSRNNSGMLVDERGAMTPLAGSREASRNNSGMQVDREGREIPQGLLLSPRISFEGKPLPVAVPISLPLSSSSSTIKRVEETYSHHRVYTRHLVEPDSWNNSGKLHTGKKHEEYDDEDSTRENAHQVANRGRNSNHFNDSQEGPSRTSAPPPMINNSQVIQHENYEAPSRTMTPPANYAEQFESYDDEGAYGAQNLRRASTPPKSRRTRIKESHLTSDSTNSSMFSYQQPNALTHSQKSCEDLSQSLQQQPHSLSMDSAQINSVPRSRSTHSQMSTEDSSTVQNQHQSTLERLMVSQQRRQHMSGTSMSVNASPEHQHPRNSRQLQTKSPHRR